MSGTVEPGAIGGRVPVLMYHRVDRAAAHDAPGYCVSPRLFDAQLSWLADQGYTPCTLAAFEAWLQGRSALPQRSVLITFDDGFAGLHAHALPLLAARHWPATVFLVSGMLGQRDAWTSREFGTAGASALLDRAQITEMARHGFEFQSHSRTHPDLTTLDDTALNEQLKGSREDLQALLGGPVDHFAYPFGRFDDRVRDAVQAAGYRLAFSVNPGFNRVGAAPLAVRRLDITGADTPRRFAHKVSMGTNDGSLPQRLRYLAGRVATRLRPGARG